MVLTLTSNDKAYIREVANGGDHKMLLGQGYRFSNTHLMKFQNGTGSGRDRALLVSTTNGVPQLPIPTHLAPNHPANDADAANYPIQSIGSFAFPKALDVTANEKYHNHRYGDNVFIEKAIYNWRVSLTDARFQGGEHAEFRMVVVRPKDRPSELQGYSQSFSNPLYDLFLTPEGIRYGAMGCVSNGTTGASLYLDGLDMQGIGTVADAFTTIHAPICKERYIVAKDCRFSLGREFGAFAFEDSMTVDHYQQCLDIPSDHLDVFNTDTDYNPHYYFFVFGSTVSSEAQALFEFDLNQTIIGKTMD